MGPRLVTSYSLPFFLAVIVAVSGRFDLEMTLHGFTDQRPAAGCQNGSIDASSYSCHRPCNGPECVRCLWFCEGRPLRTPISRYLCPIAVEYSYTGGHPLTRIFANGIRWRGTQFYMLVFPRAPAPRNMLIDRVVVKLNISIGAVVDRATYTGLLSAMQVDLSFRLKCEAGFYGPSCTMMCNETYCPCFPGFTGDSCNVNIDDCAGVNCTGNGLCKDGINSYTCVCMPGFTGENCETDIDDCLYVECGKNRQCLDEVNSYTCVCTPGYTGEHCETEIFDCDEVNCNGRCQYIDEGTSFCCEYETGSTGEFCQGNDNNSLGILIGGALAGVAVVVVIVLVVVLVIVALLRKTRKRGRYNVNDMSKICNGSPGGVTMHNSAKTNGIIAKNIIYINNTNLDYSPTLLTSYKTRKTDGPTCDELERERNVTELAQCLDNQIYYVENSSQLSLTDGSNTTLSGANLPRQNTLDSSGSTGTNMVLGQSSEENSSTGGSRSQDASIDAAMSDVPRSDSEEEHGLMKTAGRQRPKCAEQSSSASPDYEEITFFVTTV